MIFWSDSQFLNEKFSFDFIDDGIVISVNEKQYSNDDSPITVNEDGNTIFDKFWQR